MNAVLALGSAGSESVYVGGFFGLRKISISTGKVTDIPLTHGLQGAAVFSLAADRNNHRLLIGTSNGLGLAELQTGRIIESIKLHDPRERVINSILVTQKGLIAVGTDHGLFRLENERLIPWFDSHEFGRRRVLDLAWSPVSGLWVAKENVLSNYCRGEWSIFLKEVINPERSMRLVSNNITSVAVESQGAVWVGTTLGLTRYDPPRGIWDTFLARDKLFSEQESLISDYIYTLTIDGTSTVWIGYGILGLGVCKIDRTRKVHCMSAKQKKLPSGYVYVIQELDGRLWLGTSAGLLRRKENSWEQFSIAFSTE